MATAGWGGVAESSKHKEEAVKLVKWLSGDVSTTFAEGDSLVPILADAADDEFFKTGPSGSLRRDDLEPGDVDLGRRAAQRRLVDGVDAAPPDPTSSRCCSARCRPPTC